MKDLTLERPVSAERPPSRVRGRADRVAVSKIMTREVIAVGPDALIETASRIMFDNGITRLPVKDAGGSVVGILSTTDLAQQAVQDGGTVEVENGQLASGLHVVDEGATVADRMTRRVISVRETDTIARAAELMSVYHVHGLPVLGKGDRLVGIVSSLDVLGWVAGLDGE